MTVLSVNLNKIAVLRNARGGRQPDLARAAQTCMDAGCGGLTLHPRPDRRHATAEDVALLAALARGRVELNLEGNPFAAARRGYPGLFELARAARPTQVTLVPDADGQLTSDHGFDLERDLPALSLQITAFKALGCRVSAFVDAGVQRGFTTARAAGLDRVEIYTGPYAQAHELGDAGAELARCVATADAARAAQLGVNAGHDLSQENLAAFRAAIPRLAEVSIGHALISEALYAGLDATVRRYLAILSAPPGR